jgi:hypothetical protein
MAELSAAEAAGSCCAPEQQATCCEPGQKAGCCEPEASTCGCSTGDAGAPAQATSSPWSRQVTRPRHGSPRLAGRADVFWT